MPIKTEKLDYETYFKKSMHIPCVCINTKAPFLFDIRKVHDNFSENDSTLSSFHTHEFFSIALFTDGLGNHIIDNHKYEIEPNTLVFISPCRLHKHTASIGLKYYIITFSYNFLNQFDSSLKRYIICNLFGGQRNFTFHRIKVEDIEKFRNLLDLAIEEIDKKQYDSWQSTFFKSIMTTFFILTRKYGEEQDYNKNVTDFTYNETLFNFENMIDKNYRSEHSVFFYAEALNMSVGTLNKHIAKSTGVKASDIIENKIISEAQKFLAFSDYNITEISLKLGFSEPSNFTKYFKKHTGTTPSKFREFIHR